ncbi:hypothetical protein [Pseudomonas putida]|uniref:Uncharacterized protein n=1 Tax=Pseudomonas putida TaxID=303 RepID=A0AAW5HSI8_PSEPU|nr:hypothetical protein [Pseudomonas putida]MCO1623711.1 hypothetical protein [Pseudomonas putida]
MKRTLLGMAEAGEPLLEQALESIKAYNEAMTQGRLPATAPTAKDGFGLKAAG